MDARRFVTHDTSVELDPRMREERTPLGQNANSHGGGFHVFAPQQALEGDGAHETCRTEQPEPRCPIDRRGHARDPAYLIRTWRHVAGLDRAQEPTTRPRSDRPESGE